MLLRILCVLSVMFCCGVATAEKQEISVGFKTPASNYSVKIVEVYRVGDELWAISKVSGGGGFGLTVISNAGDKISLDVDKKLPVKHKVLGKSWNWGKDTKTLQFVKNRKALDEEIEKQMGEKIWTRKK